MTKERFNELAGFARACAVSTESPVSLGNKASHLKATKEEIDALENALMSEQEASKKALEHLQNQKYRFEVELKDAFLINDEDKAGEAAALARGKIEMAEAKLKQHEAIASSDFSVAPLRQAATQRAARLAISEREAEFDQLLAQLLATVSDLETLTSLANTTFRGSSKVRSFVAEALKNHASSSHKANVDLNPYY